MRPVLIYSGTTEGKKLAYILAKNKINSVVCVATEYGEMVMDESEYIKVNQGRLTVEEMRELTVNEKVVAVVDATHPFAKEVTANIKESVKDINISYFRLRRNTTVEAEDNAIIEVFSSVEECAKALAKTKGNILLTTGSKDLSSFTKDEQVRERLYARVLPSLESLSLCEAAGLGGKQIIAMQGPFTKDMNETLISQLDIKYLVTKESGKTGGLEEKLLAAKELGIKTFMIGSPLEEDGQSFEEVEEELAKLFDKTFSKSDIKISLIGIGMGNPDTLTKSADKLINDADFIIGAERLIENCTPKVDKKPFYLAKDIIPYLREVIGFNYTQAKVAILFSGDTGFYSGCGNLHEALKKEGYNDVEIIPGISTISYLAAKTGINWNDANIISIHGVAESLWKTKITYQLNYSKKIFLLLSGKNQLIDLMDEVFSKGFEDVKIMLGYQLSYENEKIMSLTVKEFEDIKDTFDEGLYSLFLINDKYEKKTVVQGIKDDEFIRAKVPMTKAEVRDISISKLKPKYDSVVYDIGSGTGSIAVGVAKLSGEIKVYALECNKDAVALIGQNAEKFGCSNIEIVKGTAPTSMKKLEKPDCAFIGGTKDKLFEILDELYKKNNKMRVVINAISMETAQKLFEIPKEYMVEDYEVVQVQINRARIVGNYNMMQGENPIFVCSFNFA